MPFFNHALLLFCALLSHHSLVQAVSFYTNSSIPTSLTTACSTSLLADISCDYVVPALQDGNFYPESTLTRACTTACSGALATYQSNIASACTGQTWLGYNDETMPVEMIPEALRYHYGLICLKNGDDFCNNVAAAYAAFLDSAAAAASPPAAGQYGGLVVTDPCDLCLVKNLQYQAGSPFYDGPDILSSSLYESKTSSCSITGLPLTTTTQTIFTPTTPAVAASTCAGTTYAIQATDTCHSISLAQGIGTSWLLQDNDLPAFCASFPTTGNLCLVNKCAVYTVQTNDTCTGIAASKTPSITVAQLKAWNPVINAGCYNLDTMVGDQLCVGQPGTPYSGPTTSIPLAPTVPLTAATAPTDIADGTNTYCGMYYQAIAGDFCNKLVLKFGISLADFVFLNPAINENCTNLFADESYCVQAVGDINTYSGRPGYASYTATLTTLVGDPATRWPSPTYTTPTASTKSQLPLATGTRDDCSVYFDGSFFNVNGTSITSVCERAIAVLDVSLDDLEVWNPSLGNTSDPSCTFDGAFRYCGVNFDGDPIVPVVDTTDTVPIRDQTTANCTEYLDVTVESGYDCAAVLSDYELTIAQFYEWNPLVGADCSGLWLGYQYCVRGPGWVDPNAPSGSTSATPTPTTTGAPAPTQTGQPANCISWYVAVSGDSCPSIEDAYFITAEQFFAWNPAVSTDCTTGLWAGYAYCVGTSDSTTGRPTTTPATTITSAAPPTVTTPSPIQPGAAANCNAFDITQSGDDCYDFAIAHAITPAQLYEWNTVLGDDGANCGTSFWAGEYYCVGVSA